MPRIINKSQKPKMVADEILQPGDSKFVSPKKARQYSNDPDLSIEEVGPWKNVDSGQLTVDGGQLGFETPVLAVEVNPETLEAEIFPVEDAPTPEPAPETAPKGKKRSKKK